MNISVIVLVICVTLMFPFTTSAPQSSSQVSDGKYSSYNYDYKVEDVEQKLFFDKTETGNDNGKVTGRYSVLYPDGRLMVVEYTADENGYVPKITFMENANPFG